jgi:hypothetical protein
MSLKNPTRGQKIAAISYHHNEGMSKESALNKAVNEKGPDQPKSKGGCKGYEMYNIPLYNIPQDGALTESDY